MVIATVRELAPQPAIGPEHLAQLMQLNRAWLSPIPEGQPDEASLLMGDVLAGDPAWRDRARAFAMHGIAQVEADAAKYGRMRHSLWTGDPGFAVYLWDCIRAGADFPTLDVFFAPAAGR